MFGHVVVSCLSIYIFLATDVVSAPGGVAMGRHSMASVAAGAIGFARL